MREIEWIIESVTSMVGAAPVKGKHCRISQMDGEKLSSVYGISAEARESGKGREL